MIRLDALPGPQRALWEEDLQGLPAGFVLYGGTAIALHLGHRQSVDFDFFSSSPLDRAALRKGCGLVAAAKTLQDEPDTLTVVAEKAGVAWFGDGNLEALLPHDVKDVLVRAAASYDPHTGPASKRSARLD